MFSSIRQKVKFGGLALIFALALFMSAMPSISAEGAEQVTIPLSGGTIPSAFENYPDVVEDTKSITLNLSGGVNVEKTIDVPYTFEKDVDDGTGTGTTKKVTIKIESITVGGNTLSSSSGVRQFDVEATGTLIVNSATITGGGITITGGNASFDNVMFTRNSNTNGGAILITDGTASFFSGTNFTDDNTATVNGGAVNVTGGTANFSNVEFKNNKATGDSSQGGAVYVGANGTANFANVSFTGNSTTGDSSSGGAIYLANNTTFTGTLNFTSNTTQGHGGALYVASGIIINLPEGRVTNFLTNKATGGADNRGGALYLDGRAKFIGEAKFDTNNADTMGGAIYSAGDFTIPANTMFVSNFAANGGAIALPSGTITVTIDGSNVNFEDNEASTGDGGAIYSLGALILKMEAGAPAFRTNKATFGNGGAIHTGGNLRIDGSSIFSENTAQLDGGAIHSDRAVSIPSGGATFTDNHAFTGAGGAIYTTGGFTVSGSASTFTANTAGIDATGLVNKDCDGGAIFSKGDILVENATFSPDLVGVTNESAGRGGAIFAEGNITASSSKFTKQKAGTSGGALYTLQSVTITSSTFEENTANEDGGAIYTNGTTGGKSNVTNSYFRLNTANGNFGGAVASNGSGTFTVTQSTFTGNNTPGAGGALDLQGSGEISLSYFLGNSANDSNGGGAIFITGGTYDLTVKNSVFTNNQALKGKGGAISAFNIANVILLRSSFIGNLTKGSSDDGSASGGAVYAEHSSSGSTSSSSTSFRVASCTFSNNNAEFDSGAALAIGSGIDQAILMYNTFLGNTAQKNGGAIHTAAGEFRPMGNALKGNTAAVGSDVFGAGTDRSINSLGYNLIGVYGQGITDSTWGGTPMFTGSDWENDIRNDAGDILSYFEPDMEPGTVPIGELNHSTFLSVYRPKDASNNPLLDVIPKRAQTSYSSFFNSSIDDLSSTIADALGKGRTGAYSDIGARQVRDGEGPGTGDDVDEKTIATIKISGIPNTLTTVGQTAVLRAVAYNAGGKRLSTIPTVNWTSSRPSVAAFSNIVPNRLVARSEGTTTITAYLTSNPNIKDPVELTVKWDADDYDPNIDYDSWDWDADDYSYSSTNNNANVSFLLALSSKALTNNSEFESKFGVPAFQLNGGNLRPSDLSFSEKSAGSYSGVEGYESKLPGLAVTLAGSSQKGEVLPIDISWTITDASTSNLSKLLEDRRVDLKTSSNAIVNVFGPKDNSTNSVNSAVDSSGITAADLVNAGILTSDKSSEGDTSITVHLRAYIANVGDSDSTAQLISAANDPTKKLLIVPDIADSKLNATLWMAQQIKSSSGSGSGGEGGGGGCSAFGFTTLALAFALALSMLLKRR